MYFGTFFWPTVIVKRIVVFFLAQVNSKLGSAATFTMAAVNNNNNGPPNPNQHLGRAVPIDERLLPRFECRKCHDFFANINRHEKACPGETKPYRCEVCRVSYNSEHRVRRHFGLRHPNALEPAHFLNPDFRHRPVRHAEAEAPAVAVGAAPAAPVAPAAANANADVPNNPPNAEDPAAIPVPPAPEAQQNVGPQNQGPPANQVPPVPEVPQNVGPQNQVPPVIVEEMHAGGNLGMPQPPNVGLGVQGAGGMAILPPLLRANFAANVREVRARLGNDNLRVIALVTEILTNPDQFNLN